MRCQFEIDPKKYRNIMGLYFIRDSKGNIKIGKTKNIIKRISQLQTANSYHIYLVLFLPGEQEYERSYHDFFNRYKIKGEWFRPNPHLEECIKGKPIRCLKCDIFLETTGTRYNYPNCNWCKK